MPTPPWLTDRYPGWGYFVISAGAQSPSPKINTKPEKMASLSPVKTECAEPPGHSPRVLTSSTGACPALVWGRQLKCPLPLGRMHSPAQPGSRGRHRTVTSCYHPILGVSFRAPWWKKDHGPLFQGKLRLDSIFFPAREFADVALQWFAMNIIPWGLCYCTGHIAGPASPSQHPTFGCAGQWFCRSCVLGDRVHWA